MEERLKTKQAAEYLTAHGLNTSSNTLIYWRTLAIAEGPAFLRVGRNRVFYTKTRLDEFLEGTEINPNEGKLGTGR